MDHIIHNAYSLFKKGEFNEAIKLFNIIYLNKKNYEGTKFYEETILYLARCYSATNNLELSTKFYLNYTEIKSKYSLRIEVEILKFFLKANLEFFFLKQFADIILHEINILRKQNENFKLRCSIENIEVRIENIITQYASVSRKKNLLIIKVSKETLGVDKRFYWNIISFLALIIPIATSRKEIANSSEILICIYDFALKDIKSLCFSHSNHKHSVLVPDPYFYISRGYTVSHSQIFRLNENEEFFDKITNFEDERAFWIGLCRPNRISLVEYSLNNFDILNAKFTRRAHRTVEMPDEYHTKYINFFEHFKYLVQVNIDGVAHSWDGLFLKLKSGRPLINIKSKNNFKGWYFDKVNIKNLFYEVSEDLSNFKTIYYSILNDFKNKNYNTDTPIIMSKLNFFTEIEETSNLIDKSFLNH